MTCPAARLQVLLLPPGRRRHGVLLPVEDFISLLLFFGKLLPGAEKTALPHEDRSMLFFISLERTLLLLLLPLVVRDTLLLLSRCKLLLLLS